MSIAKPEGSARERLLAAANELFYEEGVHTVGIDRVIERAGVAKASLYSTFGSKEELVRAYLAGRAEARQRRISERIARLDNPRDRILAIFDSLAEQIALFLERVALSSRGDGVSPERDRVNLLTLHSTKGLEFSRVYVLGVEDRQLPGGSLSRPSEVKEVEEARRLLYVGMTPAKDRLVMTRVESRGGRATGGHRFLDEMGIVPSEPA